MITATTGGVKAHIRDDMDGIPFAVKYFDDDKNIYLSRQLFEEVKGGNFGMRYVVMAWRRDSITVDNMIAHLRNGIYEYGKEHGQIS